MVSGYADASYCNEQLQQYYGGIGIIGESEVNIVNLAVSQPPAPSVCPMTMFTEWFCSIMPIPAQQQRHAGNAVQHVAISAAISLCSTYDCFKY